MEFRFFYPSSGQKLKAEEGHAAERSIRNVHKPTKPHASAA
jgi:hypothetical protein